MGKYKGIYWPGLMGLGNVPMVKDKEYYNSDGSYKRATGAEKMFFFIRHPIFEGNLTLFCNMEDKFLKMVSRMSYQQFCNFLGEMNHINTTERVGEGMAAFNYLLTQADAEKVKILSGFYTKEEIAQAPDKIRPKAIFIQGEINMPVAIVIPGGGFAANVNEYEGYPYAMKLHKRGYHVIIYNHRIGRQLHKASDKEKGEEAVRDTVVFIRWLFANEDKLGISMQDYAVFGSSAGGLIATALTFNQYSDCYRKREFMRPCMIALIYGLDWNIVALPEDEGAAVFTRVGKGDAFGFDKASERFKQVESILGKENFNAKLLDNFAHGSGLGLGTDGEEWMDEAIAFWKKQRKHYAT